MKVKVTKENVTIVETSHIGEGEYMVNECEFILPDYFEGLEVYGAFDNIPVCLTGNRCFVPTLKKGTSSIGVYAYKETDEGLQLMYSPKPSYFYVEAGSYTDDLGVEAVPEISEFEHYCSQLEKLAVPKSDIISNFNIEGTYTDSNVYSANAMGQFVEILGTEITNIFEEVESVSENVEDTTNKMSVEINQLTTTLKNTGNALNNKCNGVGTITTGDVSPINHSCTATVSSDGTSDFSSVKLSVKGKNMLGFSDRTLKDFGATSNTTSRSFDGKGIFSMVSGSNYYNPGTGEFLYDDDKNELYVKIANAWYGVGIDIPVVPGEKYHLSWENDVSNNAFVVSFYDDAGSLIAYTSLRANGAFTVPQNSAWMLFVATFTQSGLSGVFKNIQLEKGTTGTPFEKYVPEKTYTCPVNGIVENIESVSPTMTVTATNPDVDICLEYNRDINSAFNDVLLRLIALEGGV